jgi:hypothetical protein
VISGVGCFHVDMAMLQAAGAFCGKGSRMIKWSASNYVIRVLRSTAPKKNAPASAKRRVVVLLMFPRECT